MRAFYQNDASVQLHEATTIAKVQNTPCVLEETEKPALL